MAAGNERLLFYCVPKTGSTWVLAAMHRAGIIPISRVREIRDICPLGLKAKHSIPIATPPGERRRFEFCFVRHPIDWYRSFWCYKKFAGQTEKGRKVRFALDLLWSDEFNQFCSNVLLAYPAGFVTQLYQWFVGADGKALDFVGRTETLIPDLIRALELAGERDFNKRRLRRLKPMNSTQRYADLRQEAKLTKRVESRLLEAEAWVLETFYDA